MGVIGKVGSTGLRSASVRPTLVLCGWSHWFRASERSALAGPLRAPDDQNERGK
jgi:hypothetical protein